MAELIKLKNGKKIDALYNKHTYPHLYNRWVGIKYRCNCPTATNYKYYGGRGIKVCDEWNNSFVPFCKWALENGYREDLTIDRIDHDGNYEPNNCRWVDCVAQANNTRRNCGVTYNGECHTLAEWCRILDLNYGTVSNRYCKGLRGEALFAPTGERDRSCNEFENVSYSDNTLMGWSKKKLIAYIRTLEDVGQLSQSS